MMSKGRETDFSLDVEWNSGTEEAPVMVHLGNFTFRRRTLSDTFLIRGEYTRLTNGNWGEKGVALDMSAWVFATLGVLLVKAPMGFDLKNIDPLLDDNWETKIVAAYIALRDKELSFRGDQIPEGKAAGP